MIRTTLNKLFCAPVKKPKEAIGLYEFIINIESKKNQKILKKALDGANEEQRKIYYGKP